MFRSTAPRWLLTLLMVLGTSLGLSLDMGLAAVWATEERPAIGIGDNAPLEVGKPVQVLISHASYPRLEDFSVSVTYDAGLGASQTVALGHPNDFGVISWTPAQAGPVEIKASAPPVEGAPAVSISQRFKVGGEAGGGGLRWYHLVAVVLGTLIGWLISRRLRRPKGRAIELE